MPWNWEQPDWPRFTYKKEGLPEKERKFLLGAGSAFAYLKDISKDEYHQFIIEVLSIEGLESARIEGESLDRESLQSSIRKHFGLKGTKKKDAHKEAGMADLLYSVYKTFDIPLTHKMLNDWHQQLFKETSHLEDLGQYRTHDDPMQIVSNRTHRIYFEAPPSNKVPKEMERFIKWFNDESLSLPVLERASIAHVYFESIHPFEDGNGRIGRLLVEKILSQGIGRPTLIAVSRVLEQNKKGYYDALGKCNRTLAITPWVSFMSSAILQAQQDSMKHLFFLIQKSKLLTELKDKLNPRQEKVLIRMFKEGPVGFKGGLSADNYLTITKTSRATATRDLTDLVEMGALVKTGELRHTRYYLAS